MAGKTDYYETLGIKRGASDDEVRKSYRRLARKYHPDLNPGDKAAEERFRQLQEAYEVLNDPKKKQMYDQYGFYSDQPGAAEGMNNPNGGQGFDFGGFDFSDYFQNASAGSRGGGSRPGGGSASSGPGGSSFKDLFSQVFGGAGKQSAAGPEDGSDLEYALNVGFWQSIKGTQVRLTIQRNESCDECHGTGAAGGGSTCFECNGSGTVTQMAGAMKFNLTCPRCNGTGKLSNTCPKCRGAGVVARPDQVEVRIPAGTQTGSRLRVAGKGNSGTRGGKAGDLYITIRVEAHPFFKRDGDNIEIRLPITVSEAGLGAKIEVPTIDGRAILKVPQGTQNGQRFRMAEKGVENARKNSRGDQIVEVYIQAPSVNNERTRELLRELAQVEAEDPRAEIWRETSAK
ncbi:DnaJ C-terminal domain-containing protein [Bryobacter aggregatus]|uniref:DnaJ C-terminal domain-containing protein n=1 Tax=Bryobacter aggregatus TaxID=360054 RepID=UPI0004E27227|nr:DnaJ C-terminal domain-containing protein [Bryobacter aggregatus]